MQKVRYLKKKITNISSYQKWYWHILANFVWIASHWSWIIYQQGITAMLTSQTLASWLPQWDSTCVMHHKTACIGSYLKEWNFLCASLSNEWVCMCVHVLNQSLDCVFVPWAESSPSGLVTESLPPKSELHSERRSSILLGMSSDVALMPAQTICNKSAKPPTINHRRKHITYRAVK